MRELIGSQPSIGERGGREKIFIQVAGLQI